MHKVGSGNAKKGNSVVMLIEPRLGAELIGGMKMQETKQFMMTPAYRWKEYKIKILKINPSMLHLLCVQNASYHVTSGLPEDARCMGAHIDPYSGDILLKIESEEYPAVEHGNLVPELDPNCLVIHNCVPEGYAKCKECGKLFEKEGKRLFC